ncbi:MAG: hypothetical protein IIW42_07175 [Bacteroidaceae bacterium]|nr:hypothetical protein [Bacteroidaceae bacterium]
MDLGTDEKTTVTNASIEFVSPIPITEEFLEKNGFKKRYNIAYEREIDGYYIEIQLEYANMGDEFIHCHIDNCSRCTVASADIQYVHQLQNLLNIMNIKFDIKL